MGDVHPQSPEKQGEELGRNERCTVLSGTRHRGCSAQEEQAPLWMVCVSDSPFVSAAECELKILEETTST